MEGTSEKDYVYQFKVGMTCDGCKNAITRLLGTEAYIKNYDISVPDKRLTVVGPEGTDAKIMERLTKWATAAKKELAFESKEEAV